MDSAIIWKLIEQYFHDNPQALVRHHIDSYNDFFHKGIYQIFKEKNVVTLYAIDDPDHPGEYLSECKLYMGGRDGDKLYFGKPVIYDQDRAHYMYPNEARLRNMTYGMTVHYDIDIEITTKNEGFAQKGGGLHMDDDDDEEDQVYQDGGATFKVKGKRRIMQQTPSEAAKAREAAEENPTATVIRDTIPKVYLGKFPIMVQSDFCILQGLTREIRHTMGECRNDVGGYFIIDGKEKTVVAQEKFADNMLYVHKDGNDKYTYAAEILSVSEDVSKPVRRLSVAICAPTSTYTNGNIVVNIPNVRKPVPLFIVFRALGIISDKAIIEHCLLDLEKNDALVDLFIPSVHDAGPVLTQHAALQYLKSLIKKGASTAQVLHILSDFFLPHIGEMNYAAKSHYLGWMVHRLLAVSRGIERETDRDHFKCKRVELVGELLSNLFREYWTLQLRKIHVEFETRLYFSKGLYEANLLGLIRDNWREVLKERVVDTGFRKAFKGNWGASSHTKRIGIVQDLNRLSFNSALNHLRKTNLNLPSGAKLVEPRVLHSSHWGYLDPLDTPDGGSIGLHKHLSIMTYITRGASREPLIAWLRDNWAMKQVEEYAVWRLSRMTKVFVNGAWVGVVGAPLECMEKFRLYRRNALIPIYVSGTFDIESNTILMYTDAGRVCRPLFYRDEMTGKASYGASAIMGKLVKGEFTWTDLVSGWNEKRPEVKYDVTAMRLYDLDELYKVTTPVAEKNPAKLETFLANKAILEYIDASEIENALVAMDVATFDQALAAKKEGAPKYTHSELHASLILGMMGNMIIFPENNPAVRNSFSCGQSKQAVSVYHTNYQSRMDKAAVVLSYGQIPLVKSRFLESITKEENNYGENTIVAIACYTGYNVEDAILINEASLKRGLFRTSYFSTYEVHEETTKNADTTIDKKIMNIENALHIRGTKPGYDYSKLDQFGLIKEGTIIDDKTVLIGMASIGGGVAKDESKTPKKGQLGVVEKAIITDGEEGQRIAKVRILEMRVPAMGDKMASRAGQKGTIGMVIPERDMPFNSEGIRPDIIVNPHALPTRMTIGQLVEMLTGKACAQMGGFGDCTAFNNVGSKVGVFGELLVRQGFHSSGNEVLYNGMTGEQMESAIFMGPTYYMRLKQLVKDKINFRARGPNTSMTRQPVAGRANDGGLRIGEMERDTVISHGMSEFLRESMMERSDKYYFAVCNKTGVVSIYNPSKGMFMSPMADGPVRYTGSLESEDLRIEHVTKFGRSFSVICAPYSLKLMIQELQAMGLLMRLITEDNIDQIENMAYSNTIDRLVHAHGANPRFIMQNIENMRGGIQDHGRNYKEYLPMNLSLPEFSLTEEEKEMFGTNVNPFEERGKIEPLYVPDSPYSPPYYSRPPSPDYPPPPTPEDEDEEMKGGSTQYRMEYRDIDHDDDDDVVVDTGKRMNYQVGGTYYVENGGTRPWKLTHIGDTFASIEALNREGLLPKDAVQIVHVSKLMHPNDYIQPRVNPLVMQGPIHPYMQQEMQSYPSPHTHMPAAAPTPVIINVTPKIITNGNDNSAEVSPEGLSSSSSSPMEFSQNKVMEREASKTTAMIPSSAAAASKEKDTDFSQPLIVVKKSS